LFSKIVVVELIVLVCYCRFANYRFNRSLPRGLLFFAGCLFFKVLKRASPFSLDRKVAKDQAAGNAFLPHGAFALQKLATQVRAARAGRHFLAQSCSSGGVGKVFFLQL